MMSQPVFVVSDLKRIILNDNDNAEIQKKVERIWSHIEIREMTLEDAFEHAKIELKNSILRLNKQMSIQCDFEEGQFSECNHCLTIVKINAAVISHCFGVWIDESVLDDLLSDDK